MPLEDFLADVTPTVDTTPATETTPITEPTITETTPTEPTTEPTTPTYPEYVDINGEKVPFAEVQKGYLRQSDYTKKTQDLARQRQEAQEALELVEYLRANPEIARRLVEDQTAGVQAAKPQVTKAIDPMQRELADIKHQLFVDKLDSTINQLKSKYPDFDEVQVLNRASELGTDNLEFVYHGMRGQNIDKLIADKVKEQLASATTAMQKDTTVTKTLISGGDTTVDATFGLSKAQMTMADKLGMSYEEYAKWA